MCNWQPIETLEEGLFVDVWVISLGTPRFGQRIPNVAKIKEHSLGWVGIEKRYLTDTVFPKYWLRVEPPQEVLENIT